MVVSHIRWNNASKGAEGGDAGVVSDDGGTDLEDNNNTIKRESLLRTPPSGHMRCKVFFIYVFFKMYFVVSSIEIEYVFVFVYVYYAYIFE